MTEAVSHGQPVVSIAADSRTTWRNSTSSNVNEQHVFTVSSIPFSKSAYQFCLSVLFFIILISLNR